MTTPLMLVPTDERMIVVHGVWFYILCRAYNRGRHSGGSALSADAHRRVQAEFRALLSRRRPLRRMPTVQ